METYPFLAKVLWKLVLCWMASQRLAAEHPPDGHPLGPGPVSHKIWNQLSHKKGIGSILGDPLNHKIDFG